MSFVKKNKFFIKWFPALLLFTSLLLPLIAQENPDEYPTVTALAKTVLPPRDRVTLAQQIFGVNRIEPPPAVPVEYQIGDRKQFWVVNDSHTGSFQIEAELRAIGQFIYLWIDSRAPIAQDEAQRLADAFDAGIYQQVRDLWGSEASPGIDSDPRVFGLFAYGLGYNMAAYFSSENIYPSEVVSNSNEHEMFIYNLDALGTTIDSLEIQSTTAHEFQHMIRANIHPNADTWLNEGLSMFTELYLGYEDSLWPAYSFFDDPGTQLNSWAEDGPRAPHYGASLMFLTYFYDRYGLEALQTVALEKTTGLRSFDNVLREMGEPGVDEFFADWVMANYLQESDGIYGYRSADINRTPYLTDRVDEYPYQLRAHTHQYSADYVRLEDLPDSGQLEININGADTIPLLPLDESGGRFWYSNRADDSSLTLTRTFDLTGVSGAQLQYRIWYHLENLWDYAYVMVSDDDGATWKPLETPSMTAENPYNNAYGTGYSGLSNMWLNETISLDAYAGKKIQVRFWVINDDAVNQPGVAIDDIRVDAVGYSSDFEQNNGGWQSNGWVWTDNRLPQNVWVQAALIQRDGEATVTRWRLPSDEPVTVPLSADIEEIVLAVSPFSPLTTIAMEYLLEVNVSE